jgi:hypothetical protein
MPRHKDFEIYSIFSLFGQVPMGWKRWLNLVSCCSGKLLLDGPRAMVYIAQRRPVFELGRFALGFRLFWSIL